MDQFNSDPWPSPPIIDGLSDQMDSLADLQQEGAFEPQVRARSNTWPLPRPENFVDQGDDAENNQQCNNQQSVTGKQFFQVYVGDFLLALSQNAIFCNGMHFID